MNSLSSTPCPSSPTCGATLPAAPAWIPAPPPAAASSGERWRRQPPLARLPLLLLPRDKRAGPISVNTHAYGVQSRRRKARVPNADTCRCPPARLPVCSPPGHYKEQHPLVPAAGICRQCEGCPAELCAIDGCSSCPVQGLGLRMALPNITAKSGGKVYACRPNTGVPVVSAHRRAAAPHLSASRETMAGMHAWLPASRSPPATALPMRWAARSPFLRCAAMTCHALLQAFRGRGELPDSAVWPVSEVGSCGADGAAEYFFTW